MRSGFALKVCLLMVCVTGLSTACGGTAFVRTSNTDHGIEIDFTTSGYGDHPLVTRIWSLAEHRFITPEVLMKHLRGGSIILIGERHDQPDHHRLQAWILDGLQPGALVGFEMLDEADVPRMNGVVDTSSIGHRTRWAESGWPDFEIYRPIFDALFKRKHTPAAIHPSRDRIRALMGSPTSQQAGRKAEHDREAEHDPVSTEGMAALKADIKKAHCGHATPTLVKAMVRAQRFKDRFMSARLNVLAKGRQAVVIAGNGHVRKDYGMPNYLSGSSLSIGILEVSPDRLKPSDYDPEIYDFIWFTPRLDDLDACSKFRRVLEEMRRRRLQPVRGAD
jgi:uncharacterized iron-regulated protein